MSLTSCLCDISERQVEDTTNYQPAIKVFAEVGISEASPDHSALCDYKSRARDAAS